MRLKVSNRCPWLCLLIVVLLIAISGSGCAKKPEEPVSQAKPGTGTQQQEVIKLRLASFHPAESGQGKVLDEFVADVERLTKGRVQIAHYPGGTLLTAPKMYDGVVQGIADIGFSNISYTFGRFKVTEVLDLPLGFPNAWVANHVAADFYKQFKPKEWEETHVLTLHASPVNNIITVSKPVKKLEDLKGLTLRGTGYVGTLVGALGATARPIPMAEAYDSLAKRVIDGLLVPYETTKSWKYGEVTKYATEVWPLGQVYTFYLVMNKDAWNKLPSDVQDTITKYVEGEFLEKLAKMWNDVDIAGKQYAVQAGYTIIELPPEEINRFKQAADKVVAEYIKNMVSSGYSEQEVKGWIDFIKQRIDYWTKKQIELGIKSSTGPAEVRAQFNK